VLFADPIITTLEGLVDRINGMNLARDFVMKFETPGVNTTEHVAYVVEMVFELLVEIRFRGLTGGRSVYIFAGNTGTQSFRYFRGISVGGRAIERILYSASPALHSSNEPFRGVEIFLYFLSVSIYVVDLFSLRDDDLGSGGTDFVSFDRGSAYTV
jgi:hypothetical protein